MCHLVLLMPVLALPIFWFMPLSSALPVYVVIVLASALVYLAIFKSIRSRPKVGAESLIGARAEVVSRLMPQDHSRYLVRSCGELWSADCADVLEEGEVVKIMAVDGVKLSVSRQR